MAIKVARSQQLGAPGADSVWEDAPTQFTRRCVFMLIYGDTGTGRTTLALTAPGPIGLVHTSEKIEGIIQPFAREKVIRCVNFGGVFSGTPQEIANQADPIWRRMYGAWTNAMDDWARTVIMDTDTEGWEILRLARFGELNPQGRTDHLYGPVNAEWRSMFKRFRQQNRCNVIAIGQTKDEYREVTKGGKKTSDRTGNTIRAGQKEIPYSADVVIRCSKDDGDFHATIEKGWFNAHTEGMTLDNEDMRFPYIMSLITETDESEWM
jgi:hypothetical protein